ncbi:MAG: XRE family transcriptional regulator [Pseudodesulfovibrio sp.]|nr:XRE family transcriptional regulator [Pseudodesulfovibrio sp.]
MKNALEEYRQEKGLTFEAMGKLVGYDRPVVWRHCQADKVPESSVARYHAKLQIPVKDLRPDLYEGETKS